MALSWKMWKLCLQALLEGKAGSSGTAYVDVRDVARAHILAAQLPDAKGRYILSHTHSANAKEISSWLQVCPYCTGPWRPCLLLLWSNTVNLAWLPSWSTVSDLTLT